MTDATKDPQRIVHVTDAIDWLQQQGTLSDSSVITSLPDVSGLQHLSLSEWKDWFVHAAELCLRATPSDGVTIFYQTDIKVDGVWVDKAYLCQRAAELTGTQLLWHKIFCRRSVGEAAFGRPGYAHLLCFSRSVRDRVKESTADVLASPGEMAWSRATGSAACETACRYVLSHTRTRTVVDPFCGWGTVLAVANYLGLDATGVEIGKRRAQKARNMSYAGPAADQPSQSRR